MYDFIYVELYRVQTSLYGQKADQWLPEEMLGEETDEGYGAITSLTPCTSLAKRLEASYKVKHSLPIWRSNSQEKQNYMFTKILACQYFIAAFLRITQN